MQNSTEDKMPDPLDFVPGEKVKPAPTDASSNLPAKEQQAAPRVYSAAWGVLITILLVPVILYALLYWMLGIYSEGLNKSQQETIQTNSVEYR